FGPFGADEQRRHPQRAGQVTGGDDLHAARIHAIADIVLTARVDHVQPPGVGRHVEQARAGAKGRAAFRDGLTEPDRPDAVARREDRKSTRLNSSHVEISYAVFCLKKKKKKITHSKTRTNTTPSPASKAQSA